MLNLLLLFLLQFVAKAQDDICVEGTPQNFETMEKKISACAAIAGADCCCPDDDCTQCSLCEEAKDKEGCLDSDVSNFYLDHIGKSTQFRIYDGCGKFVKIKMEDLIEYTSEGRATQNKEVSFASSKDWEFGKKSGEIQTDCDGLGGDCIFNAFVADQLTKVDASLTVETRYAVEELEVPGPVDDNGDPTTITVNEGSVKLDVAIGGWDYLDDGNYLELCIGIMTNQKGAVDESDDGRTFRLKSVQVENIEQATCEDAAGAVTDIDVTVTQNTNGNNHLDLCYQFEPCDGDIAYDPIYTFIPGGASAISVSVLFVAVILSFLFV